ncbi:lipid IV(A) 3-deoxy-D-manno-octulosonic acid transferase [Rheinheimera sp. 4Y26]|uniref:lipid IV(A) 3-deoxy-D-manno-octulosonic acid transferase n=1 Tax=Rheinheimera sp. 4Y26 TaxID=2977811 RepID=UPI0021B125E8|nr:lipid IV(A) 3-deoxy-D-manno-octulosonic acid transferase [Rheinheimera sp. 4Y26]MCT6698344.1 lipid IV(A) 3-deoxy-D-manno-octulosonic acid transferase [Rheinheimera sp. 4Y26]
MSRLLFPLGIVTYSLLLYLLRFPMLLLFIYRSKADPAYRQRFAERFCYQSIPARAAGGIVVHAVSMGEVVAATPLIKQLLATYPDLPVTVTCTTPTGSARIKANFGDKVFHYYLPFDTPGSNQRLLKKLQPQLILLLETELWPNLIRQCHQAAIPVVLVNARLSARSARGYRRFMPLVQPMLAQLTVILTQDNNSRRRFLTLLGINNAKQDSGQEVIPKVLNTGNLKFEVQQNAALKQQATDFQTQLQGRAVWVAGSTHAGEDEQILQAFGQVLAKKPDTLLILVPRHPDRFDAVATQITQAGFSLVRRSSLQPLLPTTQVLLGDTMGELMLWYQLADVVFVGGSLIERGGHNPLEPMSLGKTIQSGPYVFNFALAFKQLERKRAVSFVKNAEDLAQSTVNLLDDEAKRQQMAAQGLALYQQQGGATARVLQTVTTLLPTTGAHHLQQRDGTSEIWFDPQLLSAGGFARADKKLFQAAFWQRQNAVTGQSSGRNTVWFVKANSEQWVLRHYYRGGLIGKINKDWFFAVPLAKSRAMAEFAMLQQMVQLGLPVPKPVAALYTARGLGYSADILLELIPGSIDICHLLQQRALTAEEWQQLGAMLKQFHLAGAYHSDMNCHNMLLDPQGKFWLLDFDKCAFRQGQDWQQGTMDRLLRSLRKEARLAGEKAQAFYWQETDWALLLQGYQTP